VFLFPALRQVQVPTECEFGSGSTDKSRRRDVNLGIGADRRLAVLAGVGEQRLVALDAERLLVAQNVAVAGQVEIAVETGEHRRVLLHDHLVLSCPVLPRSTSPEKRPLPDADHHHLQSPPQPDHSPVSPALHVRSYRHVCKGPGTCCKH